METNFYEPLLEVAHRWKQLKIVSPYHQEALNSRAHDVMHGLVEGKRGFQVTNILFNKVVEDGDWDYKI